MDITFIIQFVATIAIIAGVYFIASYLSKQPDIKEKLDEITEKAPEFLELSYKAIEALAPEYAVSDKTKEIITEAVNAVEQISKSTTMTSEEKKEKAIEYFYKISNELHLKELTEVQREIIDILIEAEVYLLNERKK